MANTTLALTLLVLSLAFELCLSSSLNECPNDPSKDVQVANVVVKKDGFILMTQEERVRIPVNGVLSKPITCLLITDVSGSGQEPVILNGGVGYTYAEIQLKSQLSRELDYVVQAYVAADAATTPTRQPTEEISTQQTTTSTDWA